MRPIAHRRIKLYTGAVFLVVASAWHCHAQEAVLLKTDKGYIEFETRYSGKKSSPCTTDNCSLSDTYVFGSGESEQKAVLAASNFSISSNQTYYNSSQYGVSKAEYSMKLYSSVVPGSNLRVKVTGNATLTEHESFTVNTAPDGTETVQYWDNAGANIGFSLDNSDTGGTVYVATGAVSQGPAGSITRTISVTAAAVAYPLAPEVKGGLKYYYVGTVRLNGRAGIDPVTFWNGPKLRADASFNAKVENIDIRYMGQALFYNGGGNQTWLVGEKLPVPISVKVADGESGAFPAQQVDITFTMRGPDDTVIWSGTSKTALADGIAKTDIVLGSLPGMYKITATCPPSVCNSGVTDVIFAEYAKTREEVTELSVVQCEGYSAVNTQVRNSFVVRAYNTLTHKAEEGWAINFDKEAFPAGAEGQKTLPSFTLTNPQGIAFGTMWTGDKVGGYTYRAVCPTCLGNQQVWCAVQAVLPPKAEAVPPDEGPEVGDPSVTPMLRISNVYYPNDGVSFTTHDDEKTVTLEAELRPTTPEYTALAKNISWEVRDSPLDAPDMDSGDPADPEPGESTAFAVTAPQALSGRKLPLKYMIQAEVMTPKGLIKSYPRHVKQDDIDKCRQEYIDFNAPLTEISRVRFTPGIDSEYLEKKDRGSCYAYIYPELEASKVNALRGAGYTPRVTSGYRSPKRQFELSGSKMAKRDKVKNSTHIYGEAVDIAPSWADKNVSGWKDLWTSPAAACPKTLEKKNPNDEIGVMSWCNGSQTEPENGRFYPGTDELMYQAAYCIHLGNAYK